MKFTLIAFTFLVLGIMSEFQAEAINSLQKCDVLKLTKGERNFAWGCHHYKYKTECKIRCKEPTEFESPAAELYRCTLLGRWTPNSLPRCIVKENTTAAISQAVTVKNCGTSILPPRSQGRIVGGTHAEHGRYPWMVSLLQNGDYGFQHICGGAVLNENWMITAAHCIVFVNEPSRYQAYIGLHKHSHRKAPTVQRIKISKIIMHEDYNDQTLENDIALLKTAKPINIAGSKGYVNGICLPKSSNDPTGYAKVTGWGHTYEDWENSVTLKVVEVPIVRRDRCKKSYSKLGQKITETMICAGMPYRDSCLNDSGGPLIQTDSNGVSTLIGIVSHGAGCGRKGFPGVYMKVASYKQWIQKNVL